MTSYFFFTVVWFWYISAVEIKIWINFINEKFKFLQGVCVCVWFKYANKWACYYYSSCDKCHHRHFEWPMSIKKKKKKRLWFIHSIHLYINIQHGMIRWSKRGGGDFYAACVYYNGPRSIRSSSRSIFMYISLL